VFLSLLSAFATATIIFHTFICCRRRFAISSSPFTSSSYPPVADPAVCLFCSPQLDSPPLQVFSHVITSLYLFQLVMIALLAVKRFIWALLLIIPVLATMLVHRLGSSYLQRSWGVMSMRAAYELDLADAAEQQQQQQRLAYADGGSSGNRGVTGAAENSVLNQQQQRLGSGAATDNHGGSSGSSSNAASNWQHQGSLSAAWGELYRPPGQRLLLLGPKIEEGLRQRVGDMQQRLARHNNEAVTGGGYRMRPSVV
jgi:hypothetical protein